MYQHEAERFFPLDEYIRPSDANSALLFGLAAGSLDLLGALWTRISGGDLHTDLQSIKLRHSLEIACASERIDRQMRSHRYGTCRRLLFLVPFERLSLEVNVGSAFWLVVVGMLFDYSPEVMQWEG